MKVHEHDDRRARYSRPIYKETNDCPCFGMLEPRPPILAFQGRLIQRGAPGNALQAYLHAYVHLLGPWMDGSRSPFFCSPPGITIAAATHRAV